MVLNGMAKISQCPRCGGKMKEIRRGFLNAGDADLLLKNKF
jgi:hypothetical protein